MQKNKNKLASNSHRSGSVIGSSRTRYRIQFPPKALSVFLRNSSATFLQCSERSDGVRLRGWTHSTAPDLGSKLIGGIRD